VNKEEEEEEKKNKECLTDFNHRSFSLNNEYKILFFFQMKSLLFLIIIIQIFKRMKNISKKNILIIYVYIIEIQGQCSGGIWPIQDSNIGSFTVSWRYNIASNTIQFIIQGRFILFISYSNCIYEIY
jgi:hypothetical protein